MRPAAIENELSEFRYHSLLTFGQESLMNRVETKFLLPFSELATLLHQLRFEYTALEIGGQHILDYENIYFDTPEYRFFHDHHHGMANRFKIRTRHYLSTNAHFLEIKQRTNKRRTIKWRIPSTAALSINTYEEFLREANIPDYMHLEPSLENRYKRITLAHHSLAERLTLDIMLRFSTPHSAGQNPIALDNIVIAELKQEKINRESPFLQLLRQMRRRPGSLSKYCTGIVLSHGEQAIKFNRFKPALRRLAQFENIHL